MSDYKEKFDDLHRAAKQKARELDEKLNVSGLVEDTPELRGMPRAGEQVLWLREPNNCAPRRGAWLKIQRSERRPVKPGGRRRMPGRPSVMRPPTPAKSFATLPARLAKKQERFSMRQRVTSDPLLKLPAVDSKPRARRPPPRRES